MQARLPQLDAMLHWMGRLVNRTVLALLVAACILGMTNLLTVAQEYGPPLSAAIVFMALVGTIALGIWLVLSLSRSRHHHWGPSQACGGWSTKTFMTRCAAIFWNALVL